MVRQRIAKSLFIGSIPIAASKNSVHSQIARIFFREVNYGRPSYIVKTAVLRFQFLVYLMLMVLTTFPDVQQTACASRSGDH